MLNQISSFYFGKGLNFILYSNCGLTLKNILWFEFKILWIKFQISSQIFESLIRISFLILAHQPFSLLPAQPPLHFGPGPPCQPAPELGLIPPLSSLPPPHPLGRHPLLACLPSPPLGWPSPSLGLGLPKLTPLQPCWPIGLVAHSHHCLPPTHRIRGNQ
jgi:hypothetical protein